MSWSSRKWAPYVPVAQRQRQAAREVARLRKAGQTISPVEIAGRAIATTIWGKAWCDHLESLHDYENRLPRGRTYVRNGSVIDLQIAPRAVTALVSGSDIYRVAVTFGAVPKTAWRTICTDCAGQIDSLVELLQGRLSKAVMARLCRREQGLFPKPSEIRFSCSCPDYAALCKHVAAVLYGVGARLDTKPELLFRLRDVDEAALIANAGAMMPESSATIPNRILKDGDVAALFGIDIATAADDAELPAAQKPARGRRKAPGQAPKCRTTREKAASAAKPRSAKPPARTAKAPKATKAKASAAPANQTAPAKPKRQAADKPVKWWLKPKAAKPPKRDARSKNKTG